MNGLIKKDILYIKNIMSVLFVSVIMIGIAGILLTDFDISPICTLLPIVFSSLVPNIISKDRQSNWEKYVYCLPVSKATFGLSKYFVYLLVLILSVLLCGVIVIINCLVKKEINFDNYIIYSFLGISVSMLGGSILLPASLYLSEQKAILFQMTTYFLVALLLVGVTYIINVFINVSNHIMGVLMLYCILGIIAYSISGVLYKRFFAERIYF